MKKKIVALALTGALAVGSLSSMPVWADSQKVVTLGADLTEEQKTAILTYFGILGDTSVQTLTITNQDERDHLASYVPIEQIGTKTFSCALVNPTSSGGIQVKTANLNWVTGNMIATNLSTAGVTNCEVLAASPFEVSGTGALTGVIMAYETATGTTLDEDKKELATQELVTTGEVANVVGQTTATNIVNEIKIQVIEGQVVDTDQVKEIVEEVVENSDASDQVSQEVVDSLTDLAAQIAEMQYDYEDMKETLERVAENTSSDTSITINNVVENNNTNTNDNSSSSDVTVSNDSSSSSDSSSDTTATNENSSSADSSSASSSDTESILDHTDVSALGVNVIVTDTQEPETEENVADTTVSGEAEEATGIVITTTDEYSDNTQSETSAESTESTEGAIQETAEPAESNDQSGSIEITSTDEYTDSSASQDETASADNSESTDGSGADVSDISAETDASGLENSTTNEYSEGNESATATSDSAALTVADGEIALDAAQGIVYVYLPKANLIPVSGSLTVTDNYGTEVVSLDVEESSQQIAETTVPEDTLLDKGWTEGTVILFHTGNVYSSNTEYTITFSGTVRVADDETAVGEITQQNTLTTDDLNTGLLIILNDMDNLKVGSVINGYYNLGETYTSAAVTHYDTNYLNVQEVDGGVNLTLLNAGTTEITVTFYDAEGNAVIDQTYSLIILANEE